MYCYSLLYRLPTISKSVQSTRITSVCQKTCQHCSRCSYGGFSRVGSVTGLHLPDIAALSTLGLFDLSGMFGGPGVPRADIKGKSVAFQLFR